MIRFEHLKVYNIVDALRGMRNPQESWEKNDSYEYLSPVVEKGRCNGSLLDGRFVHTEIGPNDLRLAKSLSKAGNDHAKFLRQILVSVDIIASMGWWIEMDTYKVATVANSTSRMHKFGSRLATAEDFDMIDIPEDMVADYITNVNKLIKIWWESGKVKSTREWRAVINYISDGFLYRRTWTANYQVLKTICQSDRKNHKLVEWRELVAYFLENAPYLQEITSNDKV